VIPKQEQRTVRQAGDLTGHSSASVTRWIEDGARLRNGERLHLRAERYPAGYRTTEPWIDEFIAALTADRTSTPTRANDDAARRANAVCAASGW
jgi:hypothetical protein